METNIRTTEGKRTGILIKKAVILPMTGSTPAPITGDILIEGENIAAIGEVPPQLIPPGVEVLEANGMAAMPGLINTHNHSPMSLLRSFSDDLRLMEWLEKKMLPAENRMTADDIYWGSLLAIAEMIKSGTTTYADMYIQMDHIAHALFIRCRYAYRGTPRTACSCCPFGWR